MKKQGLIHYLILKTKELQAKKQADKIVIAIDGGVLEISCANLEKLTVDYIRDGFEIEEISG